MAEPKKRIREPKIRKRRRRGTGMIDVQCIVCGATFKAQQCQLPQKKCCSWKCRNALRGITQLGAKSHFWKGGSGHRRCSEAEKNKQLALERDNHKCVRCGSTEGIEVHHKTPYKISKDHSLDNLESLCVKHHSETERMVNPEYAATLFKPGINNFTARGGVYKKTRVPFACLVCGKDDEHGSYGLCASHANTLRYRLKVGLEVIPEGASRKDFFITWARRFYSI